MNLKTTLVLFFIGIKIGMFSQVGTWKYHFTSKSYTDIETIDNNIYFNAHRAIIQLNSNTSEVNKIDQISGLSNFSLSKMKYNKDKKILLVAYENQAIDIIDFNSGKKQITPNYDITNKILVADKTINEIKYIDNDAYLCSKIGIIVFNYIKNEIKSNYIIGTNGNYNSVNSIEKINNTYYALTDSGIMTGLENVAINLQDYNNWTLDSVFPKISYKQSEIVNNTMYLMARNSLWIYKNSGLVNVKVADTTIEYKKIKFIDNKIYLIYNTLDSLKNRKSTEIAIWSESTLSPFFTSSSNELFDIGISKEGEIYYSGSYIYKKKDNDIQIIGLKKEPYDNAFRMQMEAEKIYTNIGIMGSNLDANDVQDGMFVLEDNRGFSEWTQNADWDAGSKKLFNQMCAITAHGGMYRAYNRGGVSFDQNGIKVFNSSNSTLDITAIDTAIQAPIIRISDMKYNPIDQSMWFLNFSSKMPLKSLSKDGKWRSHDLSMASNTSDLKQLIIDQAGNKWISTRANGIILFNEQDISNPNDDIVKGINTITTYYKKIKQCELNTTATLDMELDREGNLWVGTDKGIGIITNCTYDPRAECAFSIPIQTSQIANDTNKYTECVFLNTAVTAIAFDGGNNLWVGTDNGAYYSTEYAGFEALNLNKFNSPLSSKSIYDIAVHPKSGEVLFTTDVGVLGFMGQSIDPVYTENISPYFITPNPVPRDYDGLISIDGLPENSYYKITDVIGNLIYQGKSNGSRVTWNGKSLNGIRVPTGVYYIFSGKSQLIGKTGVGSFTIID